jgi:RNA polymerase sigma-70 factor (ECF subfamily)
MAFDDSMQRSPPAIGRNAVPDRIDWQATLAEHRRWLRTVVFARVGDTEAAEEVLQDIAKAAVENGDRLRDRAKVAPWLYRLAVVAALQYRRRIGRQRKLVDRYAERVPPSDCDHRELDPLDWLLAEEQRVLVRRALEQLPRRDAEIMLLKYTEDWTYRQLAERMGLSTSAVEARLHRARQKMRRLLAVADPSLAAVAE